MFSGEQFITEIKNQYGRLENGLKALDTQRDRQSDMVLLKEIDSQLKVLYKIIEKYDDESIEPILDGFKRRLIQLSKYSTDESNEIEELMMILLELPICVQNILLHSK